MSEREQVLKIVNELPEYKVSGLLDFLRAFLFEQEDVPNAETIAAMEEVNEMIRTGSGQRFKGSAEELFAMLDAEDAADA